MASVQNHLPASRKILLDELRQNPGVFYERSNPKIVDLARRNEYDPLTLDQSLVDLAARGYIAKERVGRRMRYFFPKKGEGAGILQKDRPYSKAAKTVSYTVIYEKDEDEFIVASVPALPGCHSQGHSKEEAKKNIREAMSGYLASLRHRGEPLPEESTEQIEITI